MARPTKLTPQIQQRIAEALRAGATYEHAAQYGGVHYATLRRWLQDGEAAADGPFREFCEAEKRAEAEALVGWLKSIDLAAQEGTWQAAAWKLERRYPQAYGRRVVEHQGREGGPIAVAHTADLSKLSNKELAALDYLLTKTTGPDADDPDGGDAE